MKGLPAFDDFPMVQPEPKLFGDSTHPARHFTDLGVRFEMNNPNIHVDGEMLQRTHLMNPMYFLQIHHKGLAEYWWLRNGTKDNHTSQTVMINLATSLENRGKKVNTWLFWDGGHCADDDPDGLIQWMKMITE